MLRKPTRSSARQHKVSEWPLWGYLPVIVPLLAVWLQGVVYSQNRLGDVLKLDTGKEIFQAACVGCHGPDGKGQPQTTLGFELPPTFPDFTDCNATTREADQDWSSIIHNGGAAKGFSEIMPSFRDALTTPQIEKVIQYLRGFCTEPSWPHGELNLPRAMLTEKAFPEDEVVIVTAVDRKGSPRVGTNLVYEHRFGLKNQMEFILPFGFQHRPSGTWFGGTGDLRLGYKRLIASSLRTGSIFSLSSEVTLPTGDKQKDLGAGVTIVEGFAAFGQLLPKQGFLQVQAGAEAPTHRDDAARALFLRTALGKTFIQGGGFGRQWSPMVELQADREFAKGERVNWDIAPSMQVTLNKRAHIRAAGGLKFPLNNTGARTATVMFYLLWDWFDGGVRDGW